MRRLKLRIELDGDYLMPGVNECLSARPRPCEQVEDEQPLHLEVG